MNNINKKDRETYFVENLLKLAFPLLDLLYKKAPSRPDSVEAYFYNPESDAQNIPMS